MQKAVMARDDWFYIQQQKKLVESVLEELKEDKELKSINYSKADFYFDPYHNVVGITIIK